jgi:hypothetical protein
MTRFHKKIEHIESKKKAFLIIIIRCEWRNQPENISRKFFFLPIEKHWKDFFPTD